ncbi:MAG TPA: hypothetical protein VJM53_05260 [Burkholderiales bacterium]|nr:hypothetical protein [Burkholderiales bacterium]
MKFPFNPRQRVFKPFAVALALAVGAAATSAYAEEPQSGEQKNMLRVGFVNLQGRSAYQPNTIVYPDGRTIAFVGTHSGSMPNPLKGGVVEPNGTMIVDVTDPADPKQRFHIPGPGGNSQMVRMCLGSQLPGGQQGKVYLMRNFNTGYETWDVTDVRAPVLLATFGGISSTHKHWWECNTGLAYLPGSRTADNWRQRQSMIIVDWKNPHAPPIYIRTFGLPGAQPSSTDPIPPSLHGPISTFEHPMADQPLAGGTDPDDVVGNRLYLAYGVGDDGVLQILDRNKLVNLSADPVNPTDFDLLEPQVSKLIMSPDQGGHTSMPVFGLKPPSYQSFSEFQTRDVVLLASESTSNQCQEAPHWSFIVDVTTEDKPFNLSTMSVDPREGEKYRRGNYCTRGARFGVHSSEENFNNPYYGKLTFIAYFTGGTRVWDIREPHAPVEVGFYVPENNRFTLEQCATINGVQVCKKSYMTNNVEVDNRGFIYAADRSGSGLDIYKLTGKARRIGEGRD